MFHSFMLMKRALQGVLPSSIKHLHSFLFASFVQQKLLHRTSAERISKLELMKTRKQPALQPVNKEAEGALNICNVCELLIQTCQVPQ